MSERPGRFTDADMTLDGLGPRICILGPLNSGKSTLADAIGRARGATPIHLDQFYFEPGTDWKRRSEAEFLALHDAALAEPNWVMDGNYAIGFPQRFARATGVILLDLSTAASLLRYSPHAVRSRAARRAGRRAG